MSLSPNVRARMTRIRTFVVLVLLPLSGFQCVSVRQVSVLASPSSGTTIEVLFEDYQNVFRQVEEWALERGIMIVPCMGRRDAPGCKAFSIDRNTRVSVLFVPAERRTEIEIYATGGRSPAAEQVEKELRELLQSRFGASRVKEGASW
jgi:hypothetical protein